MPTHCTCPLCGQPMPYVITYVEHSIAGQLPASPALETNVYRCATHGRWRMLHDGTFSLGSRFRFEASPGHSDGGQKRYFVDDVEVTVEEFAVAAQTARDRPPT